MRIAFLYVMGLFFLRSTNYAPEKDVAEGAINSLQMNLVFFVFFLTKFIQKMICNPNHYDDYFLAVECREAIKTIVILTTHKFAIIFSLNFANFHSREPSNSFKCKQTNKSFKVHLIIPIERPSSSAITRSEWCNARSDRLIDWHFCR